jgi:hypothetical protein
MPISCNCLGLWESTDCAITLPNPTPTYDIQLNIDVANMFGKLNMTVPVTEVCKIPSVKREFLRILQLPTEKEDPAIVLKTMYLDRRKDKNPPFYLSLGMNGLCLNNCMLDSGASTNVISLKVMKQLDLKTTRPYENVCGIDSRRVKVLGVCEEIEVFLIYFPYIDILMDILVIDVPDACGILLSRTWSSSLGGFLSMNLTHAYIPMGDGTHVILDNIYKKDTHVMNLKGPNYVNEHYPDIPSHIFEYDPFELPFMQEDVVEMFLPWTDKKKAAQYHNKEP